MSLSWQIQQQNKCLWLQCSLNVADMSLGIYLAMIILSNHMYAGDVIFLVVFWEKTALCVLAGILFMTSVLASNLATMLMALDRFLCIVVWPFKRRGFSTKQSVISLITGWCIDMLLPILASVLSSQSVSNSACIPIGGESASVTFSSIYIALNSLIFLCTGSAYGTIMIRRLVEIRLRVSHH